MAAARIVQSCRRLRDKTGLDMRRLLDVVSKGIPSGAAVMNTQENVAAELSTYSDAGLSVKDPQIVPPLYVEAVMDACKASVHPTKELPSIAHACFNEFRDVTWRIQSFLTWIMDPTRFAVDFWGAPSEAGWKLHQTELFVDLVQLGIHPGLAERTASDYMGAMMLRHEAVAEIARRVFYSALDPADLHSFEGYQLDASVFGEVLCSSAIESLCATQKEIRDLGIPMTVGEVYTRLVANAERLIGAYAKSPTRDAGEGEFPDESNTKAQELIIDANTDPARDLVVEAAKNSIDKARFWLFASKKLLFERIAEECLPPTSKTTWMHTTTRNHALSLLAGIRIRSGREYCDFGKTKSFYLSPIRKQSDVDFQIDWAAKLLRPGPFPLPGEPKLVSFIYHIDDTGRTLDLSDASEKEKGLWQAVVAASRSTSEYFTYPEQVNIDEGLYDSVFGPVAVKPTACNVNNPFMNANQLSDRTDRVMQLAVKTQSFADDVSSQLAAAIMWGDPRFQEERDAGL